VFVLGLLLISWHAYSALAQEPLHPAASRRVYAGPALSLSAAIDEALQRNPTLIALKSEFDAARLRPGPERFLMPPTFEAEIWQWPLTSVNPLDTNMYMFTIRQDLPGRGKRALRTAVLDKEA